MDVTTAAARAALVGATTCAALPVAAVYAPGRLPALLLAAAAGGAVSAALSLLGRRSAGAALAVSLAALCGGIVALGLWLPRPAGSWAGVYLDAVRYSGARILTSALPVPVTLDTVALPVCATWLTAATATVLLAAARPAAAAVPPLTLFVAAIAFVGPPPAPAYDAAAGLVAALAVLLAATLGPAVSRRAVALGAAAAVLLGGVTAWAAPRLLGDAGPRPPDPRTHLVPPYQNPDQLNPLSQLSAWVVQPDNTLFEVRTDRPVTLRWVTLPTFTGIAWLPAPTYRAAGALLPSAPERGGAGVLRMEVRVTGLTGVWLPVPDGAREVSGPRIAADARSATLAVPGGLVPGLRYAVVAAPPAWDEHRLAAAQLPTDAAYDVYRELPAGQPARLTELARLAAGEDGPYRQARRLEEYLRSAYRFDPTAPGGNGYPSLSRFLFQPPQDGGGRGTSEQFATAFAILARALGMPARVVVGFGPGRPDADGRYVVGTADAKAWPEVYLDGVGWVPFDPTPAGRTGGEAAVNPLPPAAAPSPPAAASTPDRARPTTPAAGAHRPGETSTGRTWFPATTGMLGALLVAAMILAAARWRRSAARLGRADPAGRVTGAWAELRDGLRLTGRTPAAALAVDEVADLVVASAGEGHAARVHAVAAIVNATAFGGVVPAGSDAGRVADDVRAIRRAMRRRCGPGRRWSWWLDPRPLWWR